MDIKKIVVAYDGSRGSQKALEWAVTLAWVLGSEVTAVTVVKPPEHASYTQTEIDAYYIHAKKYYEPLLDKIIKFGRDKGVAIKSELLYGHPAENIVKYTEINKADLIVTGTRGMGGFKNLIMGSVAQEVVSFAKAPVLVIKE